MKKPLSLFCAGGALPRRAASSRSAARLLVPLFVVLLFSCASTPKAPSDKELAGAARDRALSVKADTAAKTEFDAAQAAYDKAFALENAKDKAAPDAYRESARLFDEVYDSVKARRDAAQREIDKARADIGQIESRAAELDTLRRGR